jgi:hypothetical protein
MLSKRKKNCVEREITLIRGTSIDASYQVSVQLAEGVSEEKIKM